MSSTNVLRVINLKSTSDCDFRESINTASDRSPREKWERDPSFHPSLLLLARESQEYS